MTEKEKLLIKVLVEIPDKEYKAMLLQSYIQSNGPLSDEAAKKVKEVIQHG